MIGALRINSRRTAASGAAKSIANAGRQSCLGLDMISVWKSPSHGESRNHAMVRGKNNSLMRVIKDVFSSPCVAKPMRIMRRVTKISPRMRIFRLLIIFFTQRTQRPQRLKPFPSYPSAPVLCGCINSFLCY